jgi:hypothetical protein
LREAIPKLQPGVYVLAAYATTKKEDESSRGNPATQWFVVSDLGLTGDQRRRWRARVRALAGDRELVVNVQVSMLARNNEILATAKTDSRGYARFDAGLQRGEGGTCARRAGGRDAGRRLRLPRSVDGCLRSDRSRREGPPGAGPHRRASPTRIAASIAAARRCT